MLTLPEIKRSFQDFEPVIESAAPHNQAAVSLIIRERNKKVELLFIERARREGDPWSGQMAFPGGRRSATDHQNIDAAMRETREEVGIELRRDWNFGRLHDLVGRPAGKSKDLIIACHLFELKKPCSLRTNYEIEDVLWIPLASLIDPGFFRSAYMPENYDGIFQGIQCGEDDDRVIWGLTYRFLLGFFAATRTTFPT